MNKQTQPGANRTFTVGMRVRTKNHARGHGRVIEVNGATVKVSYHVGAVIAYAADELLILSPSNPALKP